MLSKKRKDARASRKIIGAPNRSKKAKQALVFGLVGFGLALATGCDETFLLKSTDPELQDVMYSGCHSVSMGETCELKAPQENKTPELLVTVNSPNLPKIHIETGEGLVDVFTEDTCETNKCSATENGFRFTVPVPETAERLVLTDDNSGLAPWNLDLVNHRPRPSILTQAMTLKAESKLADAAKYLEDNLANLPEAWKAEALSSLARFHKRLGNSQEALLYFKQSRDLHKAEGNLSMFIKDCTATIHTLIIDDGMRLNAAQQVAKSMEGILPDHYESQHFYHWASLFVANNTEDHRKALFHAKSGTQLAQKFNNKAYEGYFVDNYSHTLQKLNRMDEALALLESHAANIQLDSANCNNAELLNTLGFVQWHRRQSLRDDTHTEKPDALTTIQKAQRIANQHCIEGHNNHEQVNTLINLALVHLDLGNTQAAEDALTSIPKTIKSREFHSQWIQQTWGEIHLKEGRYAKALQTFKALEALSSNSLYPYLLPRSLNGQAQAYAMLGQRTEAHRLWSKVDEIINTEALFVPVHEGRDVFIAQYQRSTETYVESLLENREPYKALQVIRRAKTQFLKSLQWQDRLDSLDETQRSKWEVNLGNYLRLRKDLASHKENKWQIAEAELQFYQDQEKELASNVQQAFDSALASIGYTTSEPSESQNTIQPNDVRLTFFQSSKGWLGFTEYNNSLAVIRINNPADWNSPEALASAFVKPFKKELTQAKRILIQPWGRLQNLDFHSLQLEKKALITYAPVMYPLGVQTNKPRNETTTQALIVTDPSGNLPKAREEGRLIRQHLGQQFENKLYSLSGSEATSERLRDQLTKVKLFHYAGHGKFNPNNNTNSSLILANDTQFAVSDILALKQVPQNVVLSACETARSKSDLPQEGLGIAQAFVTAGSQNVIASTRAVEDNLSQFIMTQLYQAHASTGDLAFALQQAQTIAAEKYPNSDWATFRIITNN